MVALRKQVVGLPGSDNSSNFTTLYQPAKSKLEQRVLTPYRLSFAIPFNSVFVELRLETLVGAEDMQLEMLISLATRATVPI